ncbi:gamma-glutamylcyclotransferase [Alphaproteobacteria bacterium LSUCC0684]
MADQKYTISRQTLEDGTIQQMVLQRDGDRADILNEEQLKSSRRNLVADDNKDDVWLFGYGSLIWNPVVEIKTQVLGRIYGYHRRFCLKTRIGRGTPENPGLVLGLARGGSCMGVALCIDGSIAVRELDLLWKREMLNASYHPKRVQVHCGAKQISAITFVMNEESPSYVAAMPLDEKARMITNASGFVGTSREYLELTCESLEELGIRDRYLAELCAIIKGNTGS